VELELSQALLARRRRQLSELLARSLDALLGAEGKEADPRTW
jgi:hypothetical protein